MPQSQPVIALLTDFGTSDVYVGIMKGVIATRCPSARLIDMTHEVTAQNIRQAAYLLRSAYRYFPPHTIFLVVVDPGVGTSRRALAIETDRGTFVGPDNGVFGGVLEEVDSWQAVVLWTPEGTSATFHGRDLFAPAAAALASGDPLLKLGVPTAELFHADPFGAALSKPGQLAGEVLHIDHFGNVITNLGPFERSGATLLLNNHEIRLESASAEITVGTRRITGICTTYSDLPAGELIALINSDRQLEIAVNQGSAARLINAQLGQAVSLTFKLM
ncbi:MAG TPA: SAM-dependent chlorinase/fluorinase [Aggregatilineales bacterium]|nr:SAM-dependent chlorinase/fluorinase [Aggregatilineales bacterium]